MNKNTIVLKSSTLSRIADVVYSTTQQHSVPVQSFALELSRFGDRRELKGKKVSGSVASSETHSRTQKLVALWSPTRNHFFYFENIAYFILFFANRALPFCLHVLATSGFFPFSVSSSGSWMTSRTLGRFCMYLKTSRCVDSALSSVLYWFPVVRCTLICIFANIPYLGV